MNNDGLTLNQLAELNAVLVSEVEKLRAERDQLAAENVGLKKFIQTDCFVGHIEPETFYEEEVTRYVSADGYEPETPATDRIVAAQRSAFVDEAVAKITESGALTFGDCIVALCQLREGAK
ncbi:hypothetical protein [Raoultella ornithinolytica]|uniref:hypothetical protein n=1 Tax=Raoultella ornithinolytica TaxID=54291 RepID=UPI00403D91CD